MSFAGHVLDSIKRTQNNRSLKTARHDRINKIKAAYTSHIHVALKENPQRLTNEEIRGIKEKIRTRLQNERRAFYTRTIIISIIIITILSIWFFKTFISSVSIYI